MQFFKRKLFQKQGIDIKKHKNSKILQFLLFLFNFCENIDRFRDLEC